MCDKLSATLSMYMCMYTMHNDFDTVHNRTPVSIMCLEGVKAQKKKKFFNQRYCNKRRTACICYLQDFEHHVNKLRFSCFVYLLPITKAHEIMN